MSAKLLIVEDEQITAEDLRDILSDLGYTVVGVVANGVDAITLAGKTEPDLALMDIRIKGSMDGTETARILRERFNVPVVYLTAHADRETLDRAKHAEPLGYIIKPFQEAELQASIEMALHKHQADRNSKQREQRLTDSLSAIEEGVVALDRDGKVTLMNTAAERWTGWSQKDAIGTPIDEVLRLTDGENGQTIDVPVDRAFSEESITEFGEGTFLASRSGDKRPVGGNVSIIRDHQGELTGAVVIFGEVRPAAVPTNMPAAAQAHVTEDVGKFKMIAASPAMKKVLQFARRVAQSEASTILLEGESGTGKDVLAQFMHHFGKRNTGPFIALNCAAIPETLLESELFGYEKGAFTDARQQKRGILEMATGGTIFLDEIGEMPVVIQAKMLRVLEEHTFRRLGGVHDIQVDLRVVAATNRRLIDAIHQGRFRQDLYYRLNVIQMVLPALRDRKDDILPLVQFFISNFNPRFRRNIQGLTTPAAEALLAYDWPGNVRELRNTVERAMVLEETEWIQPSSLLLEVELPDETTAPAAVAASVPVKSPELPPFGSTLEEAERNMVVQALQKAGGNQTKAAALLGISRDTMRYKLKKFNLRPQQE